MMRRDSKPVFEDVDLMAEESYFTYRPLSNLPTPPPSSRQSSLSQLSSYDSLQDDEPLQPRFRGPAIHLVNLIPSSASLATASVPLVQAILSRADQPLETVALAVCILDSLGAKFARLWRLSCPLRSDTISPSSKRHTLPPTPSLPQQPRQVQLHIDSVSPEIIVLAALVIAAKFSEDPQETANYYCLCWGRETWPVEQLNVTERCIMESLDYRIMPLCDDACISDAMVDMQLAGRQMDSYFSAARQPSPPESIPEDVAEYIPGHVRSKTMMAVAVLPLDGTDVATPRAE